jgi:PAS domain S-box-containing protein
MDMPRDELFFSDSALFEIAFQHAAIGMALVGLKGEFLKVNRSLCDLVGYPEEELKALKFQDITHPDDLETDIAQMERMLAGEIASHRMEKRYITKGGAIVWILLQGSIVRNAEGKALFFIAQIKDISTRKQAEMERDAIFGLPLFLHAVVGLDGYVKRTNPTWVSTFGHPEEVWHKTQIMEFVHPEDREMARREIQTLAQKKDVIRLNLRVRCADGGYLNTVWCARCEPEGGVFYTSGFDATPLMEAQADLRRTLVEKENLLAELQRSNSEITNLRSKLLTICAWTKRVRCNDRWMTVEEFLGKELGLSLTHGMSAEAEEEFISEEIGAKE